MLYYLSISFYLVICIFLILIILVQKSKSSLGLGSFGGSSQMLFGGSGGQDVFQKITWTLITIFLVGSLGLTIMRSKLGQTSSYIRTKAPVSSSRVPAELPEPEVDNDAPTHS